MTTIVTTTNTVVPVSTAPGATINVSQSTASATISVGPAGPQGPVAPKTLTVLEPFAGDSYTLLYNAQAKTISSVSVVLLGSGGPSITYNIKKGADRTAAGTNVVATNTVSTVGTVSSATIADASVGSGQFLWVNITATTGVVSEFHLTINYGA